jgi:hypothetical protein
MAGAQPPLTPAPALAMDGSKRVGASRTNTALILTTAPVS